MGVLSTLQRYVASGMLVLLAVTAAWGLRVDKLRGNYRSILDQAVTELSDATGQKVTRELVPVTIKALGLTSARYRAERNEARGKVEQQNGAIEQLKIESDRQAAASASNRRLAAATIEQRNVWVARARAAETRVERLSAEQELEECNEVLDALYRDGF